MIVRPLRTSPSSRWTRCVAASIRVIGRVTRISAPSLPACWRAASRAPRRRRPTGTRGSSRSATTTRPGRRATRARRRSCGDPPTPCRPQPRARPAPPTITTSYSPPARLGAEPEQLGHPTELRPDDGVTADELEEWVVDVLGGLRVVERDCPEGDPVPLQEALELRELDVPSMTDDDGPRRQRLRSEALQPRGALHPMSCEPADLGGDAGLDRGDGVVVLRLDPHHARRLGRAKPDREDGPSTIGTSPKTRHPAPRRPARSVDVLDRLDPALEQPEERLLVALVGGVLARLQGDVGGCADNRRVPRRRAPRRS